MAIADAVSQVERFKGSSLAAKIDAIEKRLKNARCAEIDVANPPFGASYELLGAALAIKRASAQIDVVIHAIGILYALPHILQENEIIEVVSLGAGNAGGSRFDLETDQRVAEFKFIQWQAKGNAIREKTLLQDFCKLVRAKQTKPDKQPYLYLLNKKIPLRFLRSGRDVQKVLGRDRASNECADRDGRPCHTVGKYFAAHEDEIQIVNLVEIVPGFDVFLENLQR